MPNIEKRRKTLRVDGELLRVLRAKRNLEIKEAADAIGVHREAYRNWETGKSGIQPRFLPRLAEFYGVSEERLLEGSPNVDSGETASAGGADMETVELVTSLLRPINSHLESLNASVADLTAQVRSYQGAAVRAHQRVDSHEDWTRESLLEHDRKLTEIAARQNTNMALFVEVMRMIVNTLRALHPHDEAQEALRPLEEMFEKLAGAAADPEDLQ